MPTIAQLPTAASVTPADALPVSQNGLTHAVSVGTLLASMQPAIISGTGTLLGRISLGAGGPEPITVGAGLLLNAGTLVATQLDLGNLPQETKLAVTDLAVLSSNGSPTLLPLSLLRGLFSAGANISIDANGSIAATTTGGGGYSITNLSPVTTIASNDLIGISQSGTDHAISYANLLDGLTIDVAQPAVPASDTDTLWVAQGGSTMLRQTFAAIWSWLASKQPSYKLPVVELTTNSNLDGTVHNGRILVCSQPITLTPLAQNMGSGFYCDVLNVSGGNVTFGSGIVTSSGSATLPNGQAAALRVATYSGGTVIFASFAGTTSAGTGNVLAITWNTTPVGPYVHGVGSITVNAHVNPATAAVQFGFSTSATVPPASWVTATFISTDLWGCTISTPTSAGTWYAWVEGTDGSRPTDRLCECLYSNLT